MPEPLSPTRFEDALQYARGLLDHGYSRTGKWSLAQVCDHCATWMQYPLDGFPRPPFPIALMLWILRNTTGPQMARSMLASGKMPAGKPTLPITVPPDRGDDRAALDRLASAIDRLQQHSGPWHSSPLYGPLDPDSLRRLHLIHLVHHLQFLISRPAQSQPFPK